MATTTPLQQEVPKVAMVEKGKGSAFPVPPTFASKEEEREYLKFRLAQAFRIFGVSSTTSYNYLDLIRDTGNFGYNEGVAGHITVRVSEGLKL